MDRVRERLSCQGMFRKSSVLEEASLPRIRMVVIALTEVRMEEKLFRKQVSRS